MKAFLLAAGLGTRLRPITDSVPKCMVPVMHRPLLDYWMELLGVARCCTEILINTHYLPDPVRRYVEHSPIRHKVHLLHEEALLGTAGTLARHAPRLRAAAVFVAHADNLTLFDINEFQLAYQNRPAGCVGTMMTFETDSPSSCGVLELDAVGIIRGFHEKVVDPPGNLANAAVFIFAPEGLDIITKLAEQGATDISRDVIPHLLGRLSTWRNDVYHRDIGSPASLAAAEAEFPSIYDRFKEMG